ncbi:MAG: (d)CMP kinase [Gammaproteobacteria bacterium]
MMSEVPVITVDGPSGTGKGTVCFRLAGILNWHMLDSGALYRTLAVAALKAGIGLGDTPELSRLAGALDVSFREASDGTGFAVYLGEEEVTPLIRTEKCGNAASKIAPYPGVRQGLLMRQRAFKQPPGLIADGRDMGTVVFPDAPLKIYLTASPAERAKRRYKQLMEQGFSVNLARLSAEIAERDDRDQGRTQSPLKPAPGAFVIDTTGVIIEEVDRQVQDLVRKTFPGIADQLPIN